MPNITAAYNWAIQKCNSPSVGYSQAYRNERTVGGITYYDCSSFIYYALIAGGFNLNAGAWPFTTSDMCSKLLNLGFHKISIHDEWKPGDILWRSGHTEMVYSGRRTMGAHTDSYALADQVSINSYQADTEDWTSCYRYMGGAIPDYSDYEWIKGNRYLSESEMQNNAIIVYSYLYGKGWTREAIAGLLGNMESESTINPGIWQSLKEGNYSGGFGLVQWTPATNYTNWATGKGYQIDDGYKQLDWIDGETISSGQWIKTDAYPISFTEFKTSTESPQYLASAFLKNFERAGVEVEEERRSQAEKWYLFLDGITPFEPESHRKKKGYNFILFNRRRRMGA